MEYIYGLYTFQDFPSLFDLQWLQKNFDLFLGSNERSVAPWETAFLALDYLADVLYFDKLYPKLNQYLSQLVKPLFGDLGWTGTANDSMDTLKLRTIILKKNCIYGTASSHAGKLLLDWKVILLKNYMKWKKYQWLTGSEQNYLFHSK